MKNLPAGFISAILLVAVVLIVGIGITFAYFQLKPQSSVKVEPVTAPNVSTEATENSPVASTGENTNWKTYANTQADFSLKYPEDWTVTPKPKLQKSDDDGMVFAGKEGSVKIGWTDSYGGGGCAQDYDLKLKSQTLKACHLTDSTGREQWWLFGWKGSSQFPVLYGQAEANSPYETNRNTVLKIISTIGKSTAN